MNDRVLRGNPTIPTGTASGLAPELAELRALEANINAMLPAQYQYCYDAVAPTSMGTAGLKYGPDGKVAWDEIWTSFCDLAVAGGPPHRGKLLLPVSADEARRDPQAYQQVIEEIARGIWLVTQLPVLPRLAPGWIGVVCQNEAMAVWLLRAIVAENVSARRDRRVLQLPAGPQFQLAKEIKNVVTVMAKTCHYWSDHMDAAKQAAAAMPEPLGPALPAEVAAQTADYDAAVAGIAAGVQESAGLTVRCAAYPGWIGIDCDDVDAAVWLLRAVLASNILVRREEEVLYLPVQPTFIKTGQAQILVTALTDAVRLQRVQQSTAK